MAILNKERLRRYLELNYNVLFIGQHGVGKTSVVLDIFKEANLRWRYFSASTLDPWVDFVGVPKIIDGVLKDGVIVKQQSLELVRPGFIQNDEVDAIFFDEFNRAPDKVINAVMELIQFKSINGHKLKNLRVIWAAINPEDEDDTYSVNHLDPAHVDRFHAHITVPYKVDEEYFRTKYPETANSFIDWWRELPKEIQLMVSPRRLDYVADAYKNDCRIEDFLPPESHPKKLRDLLKSLPFAQQLAGIADKDAATAFLQNINNTTRLLEMIKGGDSNAVQFFQRFGKIVPQELVEPFVDWLSAKKQGFDVVTSVEEFITKIPGDRGNKGTAAVINNVDLGSIYRGKGGPTLKLEENLNNDLRALQMQKPQLIKKLTNRITDVVTTCRGSTLERAYWGLEGKQGNKPTNLHILTELLSKIQGAFSETQRRQINSKLYQAKIVDSMNWV